MSSFPGTGNAFFFFRVFGIDGRRFRSILDVGVRSMRRGNWFWLTVVALVAAVLVGACLGGSSASPARAEDGTGGAGAVNGARSTVTVQGRGEAQAAPDQMLLDVGVVTTAATARAAQEENARRADQMIRGLVAQGIDRKDIQTVSYSVQPQYDYRPGKEGQPPKIVGYQVVNIVRVRVRDLSRAGSVIDRAVGDGANQVQSLQFVLSHEAAARSQALEKAVLDARRKAEVIARALGRPLGEALSVREAGGSYPEPIFLRAAEAAGAAKAATPVEPGQLTLTASVEVVFALR